MDVPYCQLCSEYFYTLIDYDAHLVSTEHLQKLLSFPAGQSLASTSRGAEDVEELELVQSDFVYVSKHTSGLAQLYKVYQGHIRQMIPFGQSYIVLLDAVSPDIWQNIIGAFNQCSPSYPLFVQSSAKGRPPLGKRLMDFVLVVDIDPATTARQLAASVGSNETDIVLIPGDAGSDTTGFLRVPTSHDRQSLLERIRLARVPPRYRPINVFELWGPSPTTGFSDDTVSPVSMMQQYPASPKLNKDVRTLLASLSSSSSRAASSKAATSAAFVPAPQVKVANDAPSASVISYTERRRSRSRDRQVDNRSGRFDGARRTGSRSRSRQRDRRRSRSRSRSRHRDRNRDREQMRERSHRRRRSSSGRSNDIGDQFSDKHDQPAGPSSSCYLERTWSIKCGSQPYLRLSGFDPNVDSAELADAICSRLGDLESAYVFAHPKGGMKSVICTLCEGASLPAVNQVKEKIGDLCGEHLFVQEYSQETFHQMKFNQPYSFFFVPKVKTKAVDPVFLLIWNIPTSVHPNHLIYNMRRSMPSARSFYCPRQRVWKTSGNRGGDRQSDKATAVGCGFAVARFNSTEDCIVMMQRLEEASSDDLQAVFSNGNVRFTFVSMQEVCLIPPFSFPCHNFLIWQLDADWDSPYQQDALPDRPFVPFLCNCHIDSMPIAPHAVALDFVAKHIVEQLATEGPAEVCQKLPELLKLEDKCSLKSNSSEPDEDVPTSSLVPPIQLDKVKLGSNNAYWCLLYGPDIYFTARGFPLSMDSMEVEEIVKRTCKGACNIYVHIYPQPVPQVLTKQAVFRCASSAGYSLTSVRSMERKLMEELDRLKVKADHIFINEWSHRQWDRFKTLRPFMLPFCPVPNNYRKPHFILVWNINGELAKFIVVRNFLKKYSKIRSVYTPNVQPAQGQKNCEFCVLRFDNPEDCVQTLSAMRLMPEQERQALLPRSDIRFLLCRMEETCYVPPFLFPCHNFFFWYCRSESGQPSSGDKLFTETWTQRFDCSCHPYCDRFSPSGPQLLRFSRMVRTAVEKSNHEEVKNCLLMYIEATHDVPKG